jgi:hypothetical protein
LTILGRGARMAGELLLIAAVVSIAGHLLGDWFGASPPADPRSFGGPTSTDIEAFTAIGAVALGLGLTGWRVVHGSLTIFAGALVFALTLPDLLPMAVIFAMLGAINFGGWLVQQSQEHHAIPHDHLERIEMETTSPAIANQLRLLAYRPEELADLLRMSVEVIRHAVFSGELPAEIVGNDIVSIKRADVVTWLAQRT